VRLSCPEGSATTAKVIRGRGRGVTFSSGSGVNPGSGDLARGREGTKAKEKFPFGEKEGPLLSLSKKEEKRPPPTCGSRQDPKGGKKVEFQLLLEKRGTPYQMRTGRVRTFEKGRK